MAKEQQAAEHENVHPAVVTKKAVVTAKGDPPKNIVHLVQRKPCLEEKEQLENNRPSSGRSHQRRRRVLLQFPMVGRDEDAQGPDKEQEEHLVDVLSPQLKRRCDLEQIGAERVRVGAEPARLYLRLAICTFLLRKPRQPRPDSSSLISALVGDDDNKVQEPKLKGKGKEPASLS